MAVKAVIVFVVVEPSYVSLTVTTGLLNAPIWTPVDFAVTLCDLFVISTFNTGAAFLDLEIVAVPTKVLTTPSESVTSPVIVNTEVSVPFAKLANVIVVAFVALNPVYELVAVTVAAAFKFLSVVVPWYVSFTLNVILPNAVICSPVDLASVVCERLFIIKSKTGAALFALE